MLNGLLKLRYAILAVAAVAIAVATYWSGNDWVFFVSAADLLTGHRNPVPVLGWMPAHPGGLHLYANYPLFQMGPASIVATIPLRLLGPDHGQYAAAALIMAVPLVLIALVERTVLSVATPSTARRMRLIVLLAGPFCLAAWGQLASGYTHLDDAMAVACGVAAALVCRKRSPYLVGLLVGLAIASKSWAVGFLALVLVLERRDQIRAGITALLVPAAAWAPFLIADHRTAQLGSLRVTLAYGAPARLLGFHSVTDPALWRTTQLLVCVLVGAVIASKRNPLRVLVAVIALRLLVDPMNFTYYPASLVLTALLADVYQRSRVPWLTMLSAPYFIAFSGHITDPQHRAWLRLIGTAGPLVYLLVQRVRERRASHVSVNVGSPDDGVQLHEAPSLAAAAG